MFVGCVIIERIHPESAIGSSTRPPTNLHTTPTTHDEGLGGLEGVVAVVVPDLEVLHAHPARLLDLDGEHVVVRLACWGWGWWVLDGWVWVDRKGVADTCTYTYTYTYTYKQPLPLKRLPLMVPALEAPVTSPISIHVPEAADHCAAIATAPFFVSECWCVCR